MEYKELILDTPLLDADFKDESPIKTVEKIKSILKSHEIFTTEAWFDSGVDYCHSLRVSINGTSFGVNGKGLTRDFALASAYGELMERMQLGLFGDSSVQKLGFYDSSVGIDALMTSEEIYNELPYWYDGISSKVAKIDGESLGGQELLKQFEDKNGQIVATRFYNLMNKKTVFLPRKLRCLVCGSNGGAAGNSMEEAVVQAISEIVERRYKQYITNNRFSLPDIPEEKIKTFKIAYSIITSLRERGLEIYVKDASLGRRFPVVCVYYVDKKTGNYHTHFGAFPVLEIALERTLTESFQGRKIDGITKNETFIYDKNELNSYASVYMDLKKGNYDKTPDFFIGEKRYDYNPNVGFDGKNSKEILSEIIKFFSEQGKEILVRDASSLGFPTYNVVIPGYSEIIFHSISKKQNSFSGLENASYFMRNPHKMTFEDSLAVILHINEMKKLGNIYKRLFSFGTSASLPLTVSQSKDSQLLLSTLAYAYYNVGNYSMIVSCLSKLLPSLSGESYAYLSALKRYISMILNGYKADKARDLLEFFHQSETVARLYSYIDSGKNPLEPFVLKCEFGCELCDIKDGCHISYTNSLISLVHEGAKKLSFENFKNQISKYAQI